MILSVSRRSDIPAFYTEWFFNRLKEGYLLVRNPINYHQLSRVTLTPDVIDCIVFWTKNPSNILDKLDLLKDYNYYFQITINPYDNQIERNVARKKHIIESFKKLSNLIGKKRTIWRYDPIILTDKINIDYHRKYFAILAAKLKTYTERCIISFVDMYKKTERNMISLNAVTLQEKDILELGKTLSLIASSYGLKIETCSELVDLSYVGIGHAKCIDDKLISDIIGENIDVQKDKNQRDVCGCVESIDIGAYNTCKHGCLYCYANYSDPTVNNNIIKHDPNSPMLIGNIESDDKITDRKMLSYRNNQLTLL
ncbi:MAG: DUF1848 domain-containing protein [Clostridiaceae bacterium]|nr:DUF1848 domain-containing protein [Clostridiaceae bacterium]